MAEVIVSAILKQLDFVLNPTDHDKARPVVHSEDEGETLKARAARLDVGADAEVKTLKTNFEGIRHVLQDAEDRQVKEMDVKHWLDKLTDTSYEIDDVLDEWSTAIHKLKMEVENASTFEKVCFQILSHCFSTEKIVLRRDIAIKIKILNQRLDNLATEKNKFKFSSKKDTRELESPRTAASFCYETKIYGRDDAKKEIVAFLLSESSEGPIIPILSIIGIGGIGKTSLARLAFNEKEMNTHFDVKIWVTLSDCVNEIKIAKAILESLKSTHAKLSLGRLDTLLKQMHQFLEGKKFLLVLDNVCTKNSINWKKLKYCLNCGCQGSRIVLTAREESTANKIETTKIINLGKLSDEDSWSLFRQIAFNGRTSEVPKNLEDFRRKVESKCQGLPLAIKILGNLLSLKEKTEQWQNVLDSKLWELEEIERESVLNGKLWELEEIKKILFPALMLSYYDLPAELRKCFSYCAIFPKDYKIEKDKLIKLWIGQGYIKVDGELIGEGYFQNLVRHSFFQDPERSGHDGNIVSYKMHDIVHDFAQFLTQNECFTMNVDDHEESQLEFSYKRTHHLMILGDSIPIAICNEKKLRSLLLVVNRTFDVVFEVDLIKLFDQLTCLRTLDLSDCSITKVPGGIKKLIHLRYLNLSQNKKLGELPEMVCDLYNLQTLDLYGCIRLVKLPQEIGKLINLRHLINYDNKSLSYMPKGMERLTRLRTLSKFVISDGGHSKKACTSLECLKKLNHPKGSFQLEGLGNVKNVSAIKLAEFHNKKNLIDLSLKFNQTRSNERHELVLEALQPPQNLEKLKIDDYKGQTISPPWMFSLTMLRALTLSNCINCEKLPTLGELPSLASLKISQMSGVKTVSKEFLRIENDYLSSPSSSSIAFSKLESLTIWKMKNWEEWNSGITRSGDGNMTCLTSLSIRYCENLKALPDYILQSTTLKLLDVRNCLFSRTEKIVFPNVTNLTLRDCMEECEHLPPLGKLASLESLRLLDMKGVKKVSNEFLGIEKGGTTPVVFPKLKSLEFCRMKQWEEWDITKEDNISIMPCLHTLKISDCNKLKALPDHILSETTTLQKLDISWCSILEEHYEKEKEKEKQKGRDWPKISHIPHIIIGNKHVQYPRQQSFSSPTGLA
ncbi:putative disease resistance protein RGA3 [Pistacia vera]|uniref:putative disease resistance protein RGA3 n=1 Tax=Pistacia vera TaxID=55513 RepID=UPI00126349A3|nr:putative disease resistance protein RGA3 [Pistacia vera]